MTTDLFLMDNDNLRPRDEVRIERVAASPYPDGRRVRVEIDVTPFKERPNLEIALRDTAGSPVAVASVLATMHFKMEFVLHLRGLDDPAGHYSLAVQLYYDDAAAPQDEQRIALEIPPAAPGEAPPAG